MNLLAQISILDLFWREWVPSALVDSYQELVLQSGSADAHGRSSLFNGATMQEKNDIQLLLQMSKHFT